MTLKTGKKFGAALATGAIVLSTLAPVAFADTTSDRTADTTLRVSGNGAGSDNSIDVTKKNSTTVVQSNNADIDNKVDVDANTGGNSASYNTGGDVTLKTGDANVDVTIKNLANLNKAVVDNCDCDQNAEITIDGNGAYSDNYVDLFTKNKTELFQTNKADVDNKVDVDASTGNNEADKNTGGDVLVVTGDADVDVDLHTAVNANVAKVGNSRGSDNDLKAKITGNGAFSDNYIDIAKINKILVSQDNYADIENRVDVDADTGWNSADKNTGGHAGLLTGDADVDVAVSTLANFNAADVDCGCVMDLKAKIDGNGAYSWNDIKTKLKDWKDIFQTNDLDLDNRIKDVDADTGWNDVDYNTAGKYGGDPFLYTGDAASDVMIHNQSDVNLYGTGAHWGLPHDLSLTFDWEDVMGMFHLG